MISLTVVPTLHNGHAHGQELRILTFERAVKLQLLYFRQTFALFLKCY